MEALRLLCAVVALGTVGIASAQVTDATGKRTQFAHGEGVWTARDGHHSRIGFRVSQTGDRPAAGIFHFSSRGADGGLLTISTQRLPRLTVSGNVAEFGGPAVLVIRSATDAEGRRVEGQLRVTVRDNVRIQEGRQWRVIDVVEVVFSAEGTDRRFEFGGAAPRISAEVGIRTGRR